MKKQVFGAVAICVSAVVIGVGLLYLPRARGPSRRVVRTARITAYEDRLREVGRPVPDEILYRESGRINLSGSGYPIALAVDSNDRIYAGVERLIEIFSPDRTWLSRFEAPHPVTALAVATDGRIYAAFQNAIGAFKPDGAADVVFEGVPADAHLTSLAIVDDYVFAADARAGRILRFGTDGRLDLAFDGVVDDDPGFIVPSLYFDLAPGLGRTLWIVNPGRQRLEEYNPDGIRIAAWQDSPGTESGAFVGCCNPSHIARLPEGAIVTSERGIPRIKRYTRRGVYEGFVADPDAFQRPDLGLELAVDSQGRILVSDPARMQVRIYDRNR